jgi:hypothetical protein
MSGCATTEPVVLVYRHAIGAAAARHLNLHAHARNRAVGRERQAPHLIRARRGDE